MTIEIDIVQQYYRDALKVLSQERRGLWTPINQLPPQWDSDYEHWKPGDTVGDRDAIEDNRVTTLYTVTRVCEGYVWFKGPSGKEQMTRDTNLYRLQERKS